MSQNPNEPTNPYGQYENQHGGSWQNDAATSGDQNQQGSAGESNQQNPAGAQGQQGTNDQYGSYNQNPGQQNYNQQNYNQQNYNQQNYGNTGGAQPTFDAYGNPIPQDAKTMAVLSHLSSVLGTLLSAGFLSFIGPLIFWFVYKDRPEYSFVRAASAGAFNFNIAMWFINIATVFLCIITFGLFLVVAWFIWALTGIAMIVFHIIGAVKANRGEIYNYPFQIKLLK